MALQGCKGASTGGPNTTDDSGTPGATTTGTTTGATTSAIPPLNGHVEDFDIRHVVQQSYWYSRYNLLALNLQSANGVTFMADPMMMDSVVMMTSDGLSTSVIPTDPAMLMRV